MTFSDQFSAGHLERARQAAGKTTEHLERARQAAGKITGQLPPGSPIPQPAVASMTSEQSMAMLAESIAVMASQLTRVTTALEAMEKRQALELESLERLNRTLDDMRSDVRGFTDEGASFRSCVADPFMVAYASVVSPMIAISLRDTIDGKPIADLLKAGAVMSRNMVEEAAAFREVRPAATAIEDAIGSSVDPWGALGA